MSPDTRVVYCSRCTWWDSIQHALRQAGGGIPLCPCCDAPLYECASEQSWWAQVDDYARRSADRYYRDFIAWLRGKSYPNASKARQAFDLSASVIDAIEPLSMADVDEHAPRNTTL